MLVCRCCGEPYVEDLIHQCPDGHVPKPYRDPLLVEREKTHGSFSRTAHFAQGIKTVLTDLKPGVGPAQREALDLIATKIARIVAGDYNTKDHWLDIAGYAKLGAEACDV